MSKKLFAALLALCMVLSLLPVAVFAADEDEAVATMDFDGFQITLTEEQQALVDSEDDKDTEIVTGVLDDGDAVVDVDAQTEDNGEYDIATMSMTKQGDTWAEGEFSQVGSAPLHDTKMDDALEDENMTDEKLEEELAKSPSERGWMTDEELAEYFEKYKVTGGKKKSYEDEHGQLVEYTDLTLNVTVKDEENWNHKGDYPEGYEGEDNIPWIGVAFVPDGIDPTQVKYSASLATSADDEDPDVLYTDYTQNGLDEYLNGTDKDNVKGFSAYFSYSDLKAAQEAGKDLWITLTWIAEDGTEKAETFKVALNLKTSSSASSSSGSAADSTPAESTTPSTPSTPDNTPSTDANVSAPSTSGDTTKVEMNTVSTTNGTTASAEVSSESMDKAVDSALAEAASQGTNAEVELKVETAAGTDSVEVSLPAASLTKLAAAENSTLAVKSGVGSVVLNHAALSSVASKATGASVSLKIAPVAASALNEAQKAAVGTATVMDLSLVSGTTVINDFGGGEISVSLPYTLAEGQSEGEIVVYILGADGTLTPCKAVYANGQVTFTTTVMGMCVIGAAK